MAGAKRLITGPTDRGAADAEPAAAGLWLNHFKLQDVSNDIYNISQSTKYFSQSTPFPFHPFAWIPLKNRLQTETDGS